MHWYRQFLLHHANACATHSRDRGTQPSWRRARAEIRVQACAPTSCLRDAIPHRVLHSARDSRSARALRRPFVHEEQRHAPRRARRSNRNRSVCALVGRHTSTLSRSALSAVRAADATNSTEGALDSRGRRRDAPESMRQRSWVMTISGASVDAALMRSTSDRCKQTLENEIVSANLLSRDFSRRADDVDRAERCCRVAVLSCACCECGEGARKGRSH